MSAGRERSFHIQLVRASFIRVRQAVRPAARRFGYQDTQGGFTVNMKKLAGLFAIGGLLLLAAPAERAQAVSLLNPGVAAAVQDDAGKLTTEVRWHRHHGWRRHWGWRHHGWRHRHWGWRHHRWHHRHWHHRHGHHRHWRW
jgi:hypothetical protein